MSRKGDVRRRQKAENEPSGRRPEAEIARVPDTRIHDPGYNNTPGSVKKYTQRYKTLQGAWEENTIRV